MSARVADEIGSGIGISNEVFALAAKGSIILDSCGCRFLRLDERHILTMPNPHHTIDIHIVRSTIAISSTIIPFNDSSLLTHILFHIGSPVEWFSATQGWIMPTKNDDITYGKFTNVAHDASPIG